MFITVFVTSSECSTESESTRGSILRELAISIKNISHKCIENHSQRFFLHTYPPRVSTIPIFEFLDGLMAISQIV